VTRASILALVVFLAAVAAGTMMDSREPSRAASTSILAGDLHVHPYPGDGSLPLWELTREARRRGLDVIAVTGHNNRFGLEVGRLSRAPSPDQLIVIPGQEITTAAFHMIAMGTDRLIDWRLSARQAIAAIHAQGGVAIAAHPGAESWRDRDVEALAALDGAEVAHQSLTRYSRSREQFREFFERAQLVNQGIAPIGSSDFHMAAPLGLCRTYLLVNERSAAGVLAAIREGRTVARDARGKLFGAPDHVSAVERFLASTPVATVGRPARMIAFVALLSLAALCVLR
jgi:predicted metal-dependent phosphoesterase TrpH